MDKKNTTKTKIVRPGRIEFRDMIGPTSKYKPEYDQMLYDHLCKGLSIRSFDVGVSDVTIRNWLKSQTSFALARERGEKQRLKLLEAAGIKMIVEGNAMAWKFMMQEFGYMEKMGVLVENEGFVPGDDDGEELVNVTPERQKRLERIRELGKRLKLKLK